MEHSRSFSVPRVDMGGALKYNTMYQEHERKKRVSKWKYTVLKAFNICHSFNMIFKITKLAWNVICFVGFNFVNLEIIMFALNHCTST